MTRPRTTRRLLLTFALGLPGAYEDHPWGEDVAKVDGKVFLFLGPEGSPEHGMTVKLHDSREQALAVPRAAPTGYGLGGSGWVDVRFGETTPPLNVLRDWVEESYRLVARKRRVAELDARGPRKRPRRDSP